MGAWGFSPFENDTAMDWFGNEIQDRLAKVLDNKFVQEEEIRAAAEIAIKVKGISVWVDEDVIPRIVSALHGIRDSDWLSYWREPESIRDDINRQIKALS